jgi:hypothetical protein
MNDMTLPPVPAGDDLSASAHSKHLRVADGDAVRLSFTQEPLWILQRLGERMTAYNLPRVMRLRGPLRIEALQRAFDAVIARHSILRTRFFERDGVPMAVAHASVPFLLDQVDLSGEPAPAREAALAREVEATLNHVFDLGAAPAMVARLIRLGDEEHVLALCLHHIVSDAWSNPVFAADLSTAYALALKQAGPVRLPELPLQYADHAVRQRAAMARGAFDRALAHWNGPWSCRPMPRVRRCRPSGGRRSPSISNRRWTPHCGSSAAPSAARHSSPCSRPGNCCSRVSRASPSSPSACRTRDARTRTSSA